MQRIHTHYDTLKVARDAPTEVIKSAYRALARKYHPDSNPNLEEAVREMQALNQAFEVLTDPAQRKVHDEWIDQQMDGKSAEASHQNHKRADKSSSKGDQRDSRKYPAAGKIWSGWPSFDKLKPSSITLIMALAAGLIALIVIALSVQSDPPSAEPKATAAASTPTPTPTPPTPTPTPTPTPAPTPERTVWEKRGVVTIHLASDTGEFIRAIEGGGVELAREGKPTRFIIRDGLIDPADKQNISFELAEKPGVYLRHAYYQIVAQSRNSDQRGVALFDYDATFTAQTNSADATLAKNSASLEAVNYPNYFIQSKNNVILTISPSGHPAIRSFVLKPSSMPLSPTPQAAVKSTPAPSPTADLESLAVGNWQWGQHLINFQSGGQFTEHGPEGSLVSTGAWRVVDGRQIKLIHSNGYVSVMQINDDQITGGALCTSPSGKSHTVYLVKKESD